MMSRLVAAFIIGCVRLYQMTLSPLFTGCCRFNPSCSRYCIEAVRIHGPWYGSWLTIRRLLRCRPFGPSGDDPVPPPRKHTNGTRTP